jgi:hypothetical protein
MLSALPMIGISITKERKENLQELYFPRKRNAQVPEALEVGFDCAPSKRLSLGFVGEYVFFAWHPD